MPQSSKKKSITNYGDRKAPQFQWFNETEIFVFFSPGSAGGGGSGWNGVKVVLRPKFMETLPFLLCGFQGILAMFHPTSR